MLHEESLRYDPVLLQLKVANLAIRILCYESTVLEKMYHVRGMSSSFRSIHLLI